MKTLVSQCAAIVDSLNAIYGKGSVSNVRLSLAGQGTFTQTPYSCKGRTLSFRVKHTAHNLTVYALGHQKTVAL